MNRSELLVRYGFINRDEIGKYVFDKEKGWFEPKADQKLDKNDAWEEIAEIVPHNYTKTGYPVPLKSYVLSLEMSDMSLEEPYFWILDTLKGSFPIIEKLEDSFAAAENSAFFGITQTRLGGQQDKISQYLAQMGKMIRELFQMVRELRIIDERLGYYDGVDQELEKPISQRGKSAEITLKGYFVDLVQGGGKSAASVYGMAQNLEFITLPDLFFDAPPFKNTDELEQHIKNLKENFNESVLRVLQRHLNQYREWRTRTAREHTDRKRFMLRYLEQHYQIISMYLSWIKPYLRHVARLTMKEKNTESADIISAFEGSMLDIEILARKNKDGANACVLVTFNYRTRAEMKVVQEGYQRGPVHIGKMVMTVRGYTWDDRQLENYRNLKKKEDFLLLEQVSSSVKTAMESLGEELEMYLKRARGESEKEKEETQTETKKSLTEKMFGDFYTPKQKTSSAEPVISKKVEALNKEKTKRALKGFNKDVNAGCWGVFHFFKKSHGMIAW